MGHDLAMTSTDNEKELWRLARLYDAMSDGELENLGADAASLSEAAKSALRLEIAKRGLNIELREAETKSAGEQEFSKLVTIRKFRDLPEAYIAKGLLDSAGIECFLFDENIVRTDWFWSNAVGGVKLRMREEDAAEAAELLGASQEEAPDKETTPQPAPEQCPNCGSTDVTYQSLMKRLAYFTVWMGFPIPVKHVAWKCQSCGHVWEDPVSSPQRADSESR